MSLFYFTLICQAVRMDAEHFAVEPSSVGEWGEGSIRSEPSSETRSVAVVEAASEDGLDLPEIEAIADFSKVASWKAFQRTKLEDYRRTKAEDFDAEFDIDDIAGLRAMQANQPTFRGFVTKQVAIFGKFASAQSIEERITQFLRHFAEMDEFMKGYDGRDGDKQVGEDGRPALLLYIFVQAVPEHPKLLVALTEFRNEFSSKLEAVHGRHAGMRLNFDSIEIPETFSEVNRDRDLYLTFVEITSESLNHLPRKMSDTHQQVLVNYRQRVVAEARRANVPNALIALTCKEPNWQEELHILTQFNVTQIFVPVWQVRGDVDRAVTLESIAWFLMKPSEVEKAPESDLTRIVARQGFGNGYRFFAVQLQEDPVLRVELIRVFINLALRLESIDEGRFLAGLIRALWLTKSENMAEMWKRHLYKRRHLAFISWRQWLQENVLLMSNDNTAAKEIIKATIEKATGESRNAPVTAWTATAMCDALKNYFEDA